MRLFRVGILWFVSAIAVGAAFASTGHAAGGFAVPPADGEAGIASPDSGPRYFMLGARGTQILAKFEGERIAVSRGIPSAMSIPAVTLDGEPGGLSADARTLALSYPGNAFSDRSEFLFLRARDLKTIERITLDGSFVFDAISPDGSLVYLVELIDPRNPLDYDVRIYDIEAGRLVRDPVVDPSEPEEQMGGYPFARAASADGRWAYTLYDGGREPFIHALDTVGRTAVCVDLDELGVPIGNGSTLEVSDDGGSLLLGSRGEPAATIDTTDWEVTPIEESPESEAAASGDTSADAWMLVAAIGILALLVGGLLRWRGGAARGPDGPAQPIEPVDPAAPVDPASMPSDPSMETNASTSDRARSGSIP